MKFQLKDETWRNCLCYIVMPWCIYSGVNRIHDFDIKYFYEYWILYMECNAFICTIVFGILESSKIALFKDLLGKIFEAKDFELNYLQDKFVK